MKKNVILVAAMLAGVCGAASAQVVTFDEFGVQPVAFASTTALRNEYAGQGVLFSGRNATDGGGILSVGSNFGVNPRSGDNFLAFNESANFSGGGIPIGPQTITFVGGATSVSIYGTLASLTMDAFDANNNGIGTVTIGQNNIWQELALTGNISYVVISATGSATYLMDDLSWTPVPAPSSIALAGVIALGAARRRR